MLRRSLACSFANRSTGVALHRWLPLVLALIVLLACVGPALAQEPPPGPPARIWVGELKRVQARTSGVTSPIIEIDIVQDNKDGRIDRFSFERSVTWSPTEAPKIGARIQLDGVFPAELKSFDQRFEGSLLKHLHVEASGQCIQNPQLRQTPSGRQLEHSVLVVESERPIVVTTTVLRDQGGDQITLALTISEKPAPSAPVPLTNSIDLSSEAFDRPAGSPIASPYSIRTQELITRSLAALRAASADDYVTAVYPAQFADPNTLAGLTRGRLSQLGRIDVDSERALMVITDRVRFVRPVLETLIALDQRPPQVTVVAQIIEVNRSSGTRMGVDFSYLGKRRGSGLVGGGASTTDILGGGPVLSGVYQSLSSSALERFAADVNVMVERRYAKITAQPVVRVLNNARGTFNSGEELPFFIETSASSAVIGREGSSTGDFRRSPGEGIAPNTILREQRTDGDQSETRERRENFSIRQVSTGTRLSISPQIRNSDECLLSLTTSFRELTGYAAPSGNPIIAERSVDTRVRVKHGETIVLAGLYRQVEVKQMQGLPFLSDIPGIGKIFQSERTSKETYDIIFVLTTFLHHT